MPDDIRSKREVRGLLAFPPPEGVKPQDGDLQAGAFPRETGVAMRNEIPYPDWLDRRASNAQLIAGSRAAIARGRRLVETSDQLMRVSAKLMPRSSLAAPPPQTSAWERRSEADEAARRQASAERQETEGLRQTGYSLRSYAEEMVVTSQEIRWQARQIRLQAGAQRARARQIHLHTRDAVGEATYRVIVDGLSDYGVEVRRPGQFQSVRGFRTHMAALRWIADQKAAGHTLTRILPAGSELGAGGAMPAGANTEQAP